MKRVAITGMGMIDTLGNSPEVCYNNFVSKTYIDPKPYKECKVERYQGQNVFPVDLEGLDLPEEIKPAMLNNLERGVKYSLHAIKQALADSGVEPSSNVATIASNITAGNQYIIDVYPKLYAESGRVRPRQLLGTTKDFLVGMLTEHYGWQGPSTSMYAACATSLFNIDYAMRFVDDYDYVVCTVSDHGINETDISFFSQLGALGTHSAPWDDDRDGFVMGEGGACFILESEEKAKARGANIHAYLHPVGFGSDAFNATSPSTEGIGAKAAMRNAIKGIDKTQIGFVNAHGTSTPAGDEIEYRAILDVLGPTEIVSCKSKIGHTMGACGMIEAIYSIMALKKGAIPDNHNLNVCSFDLERIITNTNRLTHKRFAINNSFGFGGKCASQVIEINEAE